MQVPATGILVLKWPWEGPSAWPCSESHISCWKSEGQGPHREVFIFFCPHSLSCSSLFMGELGGAMVTFFFTRSWNTWFCHCIKKKGRNLFTRSSNSLASWIRDTNLALVKAKNTLFPDMWKSTWIVQVLNCYRRYRLLRVQGRWTRVSLLKWLRYFTKWTYISFCLWSVCTSPFWRD